MYFTTVCMCSRRSLTARLISIGHNREGVCMIMYLMYCIYIHTYICAFKRTIRWGKKNKEQEKKRKKRKKEKKRETGSFSVSLALFFLPKIIRVILESGFAYFFFFFWGGRRVLVLAVPPRLCYQLKVTPPPKKKSPIDLASRLSSPMRTFAM